MSMHLVMAILGDLVRGARARRVLERAPGPPRHRPDRAFRVLHVPIPAPCGRAAVVLQSTT